MSQLFPVDKNAYIQKYLQKMKFKFMRTPELYFDPVTGELFDEEFPIKERIVVSINPRNYPVYENDDYAGYMHHDRMRGLEECRTFWIRE